MYVDIVVIGDGTIFQEQTRWQRPEKVEGQTPEQRTDAVRKAGAYHNYPMMSGVGADAAVNVFWADGTMYVGLSLNSLTEEDMKEQPNIYLVIEAHTFEALIATVRSKRRELELRTFPDPDDDALSI